MNRFIRHSFTLGFVILLLTVGCEMSIYTGPEEKSALSNRILHLTSEPDGFLIMQDGINYGFTTPDSLTWIESDTAIITLSKQYFRDSSFVIVFDSNNTEISKHINFSTNPLMTSSISCESSPSNATIYLDGELTDYTTPHTFNNILPGYHDVVFSYPDHESADIIVTLYSNTPFLAETSLIDSSVWVIYNEDKYDIPINECIDIHCVNGVTYAGLNNRGLAKYSNGTWEVLTGENSILPDDYVSCFFSKDNTTLIGTANGLYEIKDGVERIYNHSNSQLFQNEILSLFISDNNDYLIGTPTTFYIFDGLQWQSWNPLNSNLPQAEITAVAVDDQNEIWTGSQLGLARLANDDWEVFSTQDYLRAPIVCSSVDNFGKVYFVYKKLGSEIYSLVSRANGSWDDIEQIQLASKITGISFDTENNLWLATEQGLLKYDGTLTEYTTENSLLPGNMLTGVDCDEDGNIWVSSLIRGIIKFKPYNL